MSRINEEDFKMAYFTCDNCNFTFLAQDTPETCPDCGKSKAKRIINNGSYSAESIVPAIRPASDAELVWFRRVQAELATDAVWASA